LKISEKQSDPRQKWGNSIIERLPTEMDEDDIETGNKRFGACEGQIALTMSPCIISNGLRLAGFIAQGRQNGRHIIINITSIT
jgi:hypothetical protein